MTEDHVPTTTEPPPPRVEDAGILQTYADSLQADIEARREAIRELKREYGLSARVNEDLRRKWTTEIDGLKATLAQLEATHAARREAMQNEVDTLQNQIDSARRIRDELTQLRYH